jgi:hypothetical protein
LVRPNRVSIKGDGEQQSARFATKTPVPQDFAPAGQRLRDRSANAMAGIGPLRRIAASAAQWV